MLQFNNASTDQAREAAFAQAWANLYMVRRVWPNDASASVQSALLLADLGAAWGLQKNIVEVLNPALKDAKGTADEPRLEYRLGRAYEELGDAASAEQHLLAAERSLLSAHSGKVESSAVLMALGLFYKRHAQDRAAIQRFHSARDLTGQDPLHQAECQLEALKAAAELTDDPTHDTARAEFDVCLRKITSARGTKVTVSDNRTINTLESDANRIRDRLRLR
jgi:tetratricopeptide (TPR) repeat protein